MHRIAIETTRDNTNVDNTTSAFKLPGSELASQKQFQFDENLKSPLSMGANVYQYNFNTNQNKKEVIIQ